MQSKGRSKLFIENILVYGMGSMISKFVPLIMLPIITKMYPNIGYLGLNDLSATFISFAAALAVCGTYDAMFRLFFDNNKEEWKVKVCSTAFVYVCISSVIISIICTFFRKQIAEWYFDDAKYEVLVMVTIMGFLISATNQIVSAPTRIQNKRKVFIVTNTISPIISYSVAIPLILKGYYIMAMPIATVIAALTLEVSFAFMNRHFFNPRRFDKSTLVALLKIGLPLLPNFLIYWVYNSADKLMITKLIDIDAAGVYSVASKIGHISNLIYTAFASGWLYFAYSTMNDDDQVQLKSRIFEYMGAISFVATTALMCVCRLGFTIFFPKSCFDGYLVTPYLFVSPLMLMLYQIIANQFTIVKKTYMNLLTLSVGALLNVALNFMLIPLIGIEGASIATISGYIVSILLCVCWLTRMKLIGITTRTGINTLIFVVFFLLWRFVFHSSYVLSIASGLIVIAAFAVMYKEMIISFLKKRRKS